MGACSSTSKIYKGSEKSLCKIRVKKNEKNEINSNTENGFFMEVGSKKCLITNNHVISQKEKNDDIEIEIWNKKKMTLKLSDREIKYFPKPKDITTIEINNTDEIFEEIQLLNSDSNNINDYGPYKNNEVYSIKNTKGNNQECESGIITNIRDFEFDHNIQIDKQSIGCPILLKKEEKILVIGIHNESIPEKKLGRGIFIGEIFKGLDYSYIIAEIDIKADQVNKDTRILNSYEESIRSFEQKEIKKEEINEEEIKNCVIKIDNENIPFNYKHKFNKKGKHSIQYFYNNLLNKTTYMFFECSSLTNIDLSNLNTQNIIDMSGMFQACSSLTALDLSCLDTRKVTNMSGMFLGCESLLNLNLSNFNTKNVNDMNYMFHGCKSLTNLDLLNFDTQNVTNMQNMFYGCESLKSVNLLSFNTENVTNMSLMFYKCESLANLDLSSFNTIQVKDMSWMFYECKSLIKLDLSNFNADNVFLHKMNNIFEGCVLLKKENLITKDTRIISKYKEKRYN